MKEQEPHINPLDSFDGVGMSHDDDRDDIPEVPHVKKERIWEGMKRFFQRNSGAVVYDLDTERQKRAHGNKSGS